MLNPQPDLVVIYFSGPTPSSPLGHKSKVSHMGVSGTLIYYPK